MFASGSQVTTLLFQNQMRATFLRDDVGVRERETIGVNVIMWSSDYPHSETTWPESKQYIDAHMGDIPEHQRKEIQHFFQVYKDLEDKAVTVEDWHSARRARDTIMKYAVK